MHKYFFLVSGEAVDLAKAELESLVQMIDPQSIVEWHDRLAIAECEPSPVHLVLSRAALVKQAGEVIAICSMNEGEEIDFRNHIRSCDTFCVRSQNRSFHSRKDVERRVGNWIRQQTNAQVSLKSPVVRVFVFDLTDCMVVCKAVRSNVWKELKDRSSRKKPFFHPSMMNSTLARVMCNMAQVRPEEIVVDPFCGGGGIICEAASLGAKVIGIDLNRELIRGAADNLKWLGTANTSLLIGDSRCLPLSRVDCIVSDPPYGHASSTLGEDAVDLVEKLLIQIGQILSRDGRICLCGSTEMGLGDILENKGYTLAHRVNVRVHKSLTREVVVALR